MSTIKVKINGRCCKKTFESIFDKLSVIDSFPLNSILLELARLFPINGSVTIHLKKLSARKTKGDIAPPQREIVCFVMNEDGLKNIFDLGAKDNAIKFIDMKASKFWRELCEVFFTKLSSIVNSHNYLIALKIRLDKFSDPIILAVIPKNFAKKARGTRDFFSMLEHLEISLSY